MEITPDLIIESIIDELATGELGQAVDAFHLTRLADGVLRLDYGELGEIEVAVTRVDRA